MSELDPMDFREALSHFASGVTVVTTVDETGGRWGFTASAFSSLSLDPPLVLVCLEKKAESHPAFSKAQQFAISILAAGQDDTAWRFAKRGTDKFGGVELTPGPATQMPLIPDALVHLECRAYERLPGGDHTILVGEVLSARTSDASPMVHFNRTFGRFTASE